MQKFLSRHRFLTHMVIVGTVIGSIMTSSQATPPTREDVAKSAIIKSKIASLIKGKANMGAKGDEKFASLPYFSQTDAFIRSINKIDTLKMTEMEVIKTYMEKFCKFPEIKQYYQKNPSDPFFRILSNVLSNERRHNDKIALLHATSAEMAFLYDVMTEFRTRLQAASADKRITFRIFEDAFKGIEDAQQFKKAEVLTHGTLDDTVSPTYARAGLSVNLWVFGSDGENQESTYEFFFTGNTVVAPNPKKFFSMFMKDLGFSQEAIDSKWAEYEKIFTKYYDPKTHKNGRLYQIFVSPQIVDKLAYAAKPFGIEFWINWNQQNYDGLYHLIYSLREKPDSFFSFVQKAGEEARTLNDVNIIQGRVYVKPEIMTNPEYVEVHDYWRYPLEHKQSMAYKNEVQTLVDRDLKEWLKDHPSAREGMFAEDEQSLSRLNRMMVRGETGEEVGKEESNAAILAKFTKAIKDGSVAEFEGIIQKYPKFDIAVSYAVGDELFQEGTEKTSLLQIALENKSEKILKKLLDLGVLEKMVSDPKQGANEIINLANKYDNSMLIDALVAKNLYFKDANETYSAMDQIPVLRSKNVQAFNALLKHYLTQTTNRSQINALLLKSARFGTEKNLKALLENGVDVSATNPNGLSALHFAIDKGETQKVKILLEHKANANAADKEGDTPLHVAATRISNGELVKLLIDHGANKEIKNKAGQTPLDIAKEKGFQGLVEILEER